MEGLGVVEAKLGEHERRIESLHTGIGSVRGEVGVQGTKLAVFESQLVEVRDDLGEIRKDIISLKRAFWTAAGSLALTFVAITTLLVTIATGSA